MARGVNKAILVGNLGKDPEVRYNQAGSAMANINVATTDSWKDKQTGETQERTEWHRVVFFGRLAEVVGEYLKKGSQVYIEGRIQTRKWQDKEGNDRYTTEVVAKEMQMLGGKGGGQRSESQDTGYDESETNQDTGGNGKEYGEDDFDDDIPFITRAGMF